MSYSDMKDEDRTWEAWEKIHQRYEFGYHKNEGIKWVSSDEQFIPYWGKIFDFIGIAKIEGKNLLDIGCGLRPPFALLADKNKIYAIEPLADKYYEISEHAWWDVMVKYSTPAEIFHPELEGKMDVVMSWNNLDHTIGWKQILENMARYSHKDSIIAISTDFHPAGIGHPGYPKEEFLAEMAKYFDIVKETTDFSERDCAWVLKKKIKK